MNNILNKMINSKIVWILMVVILLILIFILVKPNEKNKVTPNDGNTEIPPQVDSEIEEINFKLKGDSKITIYLGEKYIEPGYVAYDENNNDISSLVSVSGEVDESVVGVYKITYTIKYKNQTSRILTRQVHVLAVENKEVNFKLNGDDTIYLPVNGKYNELGATTNYNNKDISDKIIIHSNLITSIVGEYEVTYSLIDDDINKNLTRKIIVFDINDFFTISDTSPTNEDVSINVNTNGYFKSIVLPNNIVKTESSFKYNVSENGVYKFVLYDKNGLSYIKEITINNIDKTKPIGTCVTRIYNDYVETITNAFDNKTISSYRYILDNQIDELVYSSIFKTKEVSYVNTASVEVSDSANNKKIITCQVLDDRKPVFIDGNKCSDQYIYKGTKYSLTDSQKKKLAAMIKSEYGSDLLGMKAVASHMANLYEYKKWNGNTSKSFYDYITTTTWYASGTRKSTSYNSNSLQAVEDCIVNGNRILPLYIDEFDWFPYDLKNYKNESYYIPNETKVANIYVANGTVWFLTI